RGMTVEKPLVATWERVSGCKTDQEARDFAAALARKRARFAFPDDFNQLVNKLSKRLTEKHDKQTHEGRALRSLREIRVSAQPSWDSNQVELMLWFVKNDGEEDFEGTSWAELLRVWLNLIPARGRFTQIYGQVTSLDE